MLVLYNFYCQLFREFKVENTNTLEGFPNMQIVQIAQTPFYPPYPRLPPG